MLRRQFNKLIAAIFVAPWVSIASPAAVAKPRVGKLTRLNLLEDGEYGVQIPIPREHWDEDGGDVPWHVMKILIHDAKQTLPFGTVFEIRGIIPSNYGSTCGLAWYWSNIPGSSTEQQPLFTLPPDKGIVQKEGGYLLIARIKNEAPEHG